LDRGGDERVLSAAAGQPAGPEENVSMLTRFVNWPRSAKSTYKMKGSTSRSGFEPPIDLTDRLDTALSASGC